MHIPLYVFIRPFLNAFCAFNSSEPSGPLPLIDVDDDDDGADLCKKETEEGCFYFSIVDDNKRQGWG